VLLQKETELFVHVISTANIDCFQGLQTEMRSHMEQYQREHLAMLADSVEQLMAKYPKPSPDVAAMGAQLQNFFSASTSAECEPQGHAMAAAVDFEEDLKKPKLKRAASLATQPEKSFVESESMRYGSGEYAVEQSHDVVLQLRNQVASQQQHIIELQSKVNYLESTVQDARSDLQNVKLDFKRRLCHGSFVWRLKNYKKLREEARLGAPNCVLHSPGFYTSFNGYQFCIRLNLNGVENAQGTHLSLFIHLMQSENDDILAWPFTGKVTLTICDQHQVASKRTSISETLVAKPGLAAFQRPTTFRNHKGFGYMEFAPISYLESEDRFFIKDDVLLIKAEVRSTSVS